MFLNNTWTNDEDYSCFIFNVFLTFSKENYLERLFEFNKAMHSITWKHRLLMTLSPDYCSARGIDYIDHYYEFLLRNKDIPSIIPRIGYEFYKKGFDTESVSLMFFRGEDKMLRSEYVHYLLNGLYGDPVYVRNGKDVEIDKFGLFIYNSTPLRLYNLNSVKFNDFSSEVKVSFSIESHLTIWKDWVYGFKYLDESGRIKSLEQSDNREIAYRNTPRLNSFFRDLQLLVGEMGGKCDLYIDYKLEDSPNTRKGLPLDGKIIYQEDIDEGRVKLP